MSNPSGLKITRDYVVYQPREQCVFPIEDADWRRLKRLINNIVPQRRLFEVLSSISFGVFASAILSLVAFYATKDLAPWVLPTTWLTLGCSFVLGISFEMLYRQQHKVSTASVSVILDEMDQLEKDFVSPAENVIDKSEKIPINNLWQLNHWGSDCASIDGDKMYFSGTSAPKGSDGSHIDLNNKLEIGKTYEISCFAKSDVNTDGKFQLWCHDQTGVKPDGASASTLFKTPTTEGEIIKVNFTAAHNNNVRIHLQYTPGKGRIEISDVRIAGLKL